MSLAEPLAPAVAAERAGLAVDPSTIESRIAQLRQAGFTVVVEGAGGVMVPLAWGFSVLDLAAACGLEAVIVGRAGLGTLNHVSLTAAMLRSRGIAIRCVVLNGRGTPPNLAEQTNPAALARLLPRTPVLEIAHVPDDPIAHAEPIVATIL